MRSNKNYLNLLTTTALVLCFTATMGAQAGLKGSLKKASKSAESAMKQTTQTSTPNPYNTISIDDALDQQADIGRTVTNSLMYLAEAQYLMAEAVGLKEEAAIAKQNADDLAAGNITGADDLDIRVTTSEELQQKLDEKMESGLELDEEGKEQFRAALKPYAMGTTTMVLSAKIAAASASAIMSSGDPQIVMRLAELKYLITFGQAAPDLMKTFRAANQTIIAFANANDIDTSELEAETAGWGEDG